MINIKPELVSTITAATSLPVYYELFYKPGAIPAITYIEVDDAALYRGTTQHYSTLRYEIKIWATDMDTIAATSIALDAALTNDGWTRYTAFEQNDGNNTIIKVLRYVATGYDEV